MPFSVSLYNVEISRQQHSLRLEEIFDLCFTACVYYSDPNGPVQTSSLLVLVLKGLSAQPFHGICSFGGGEAEHGGGVVLSHRQKSKYVNRE